MKISSYTWKDWLVAIGTLLCIKLLIYIGFNEGDIYLAMIIGLPIFFISLLLYFSVRLYRLEKKSEKISIRIEEGMKELERITKE